MWEEADRRGRASGEKGGYGSAEGTREVVRFMVSKLGDEYSAYLGPAEVGGWAGLGVGVFTYHVD